MSDLAVLHALINEIAPISKKDRHPKPFVVLEEMGDGQEDGYSVTLSNVPDDLVAIKTDQFPSPKGFFKNDKGECKRADYVLITEAQKWIVYIEMKGGKIHSSKEVIQQLQGTECLLIYCQAVGRKFWQDQRFLDIGRYRQRFVCIMNVKVNKQGTKPPRRSKLHDKPEDVLKLPSPANQRLPFLRLVGES